MPKSWTQLQRRNQFNSTPKNHNTLRIKIKFDFNIVRDRRDSLRVMHTTRNETSNVETDTTWREDTCETKMDLDACKPVLLARAVAFSYSFGNCHKCRGYLTCTRKIWTTFFRYHVQYRKKCDIETCPTDRRETIMNATSSQSPRQTLASQCKLAIVGKKCLDFWYRMQLYKLFSVGHGRRMRSTR